MGYVMAVLAFLWGLGLLYPDMGPNSLFAGATEWTLFLVFLAVLLMVCSWNPKPFQGRPPPHLYRVEHVPCWPWPSPAEPGDLTTTDDLRREYFVPDGMRPARFDSEGGFNGQG
jgi:hypothetical protein